MLFEFSRTTFAAALLLTSGLQAILAQGSPVILNIDVENFVQYNEDTPDLTKLATDPNVTTPNTAKNFGKTVHLADIVAVNGQPAKGTMVVTTRTVTLRPSPTASQAIADITRNSAIDFR